MLIGLNCSTGGVPIGAARLADLKRFGCQVARIEAGPDPIAAIGEVTDAGLRALPIALGLPELEVIHGGDVEWLNEPNFREKGFLKSKFSHEPNAKYLEWLVQAVGRAQQNGFFLWVGSVSNLHDEGLEFLSGMPWKDLPLEHVGCSFHRYPRTGDPLAPQPGSTSRDHEVAQLREIVGADRRLALTEVGYSEKEYTRAQIAANLTMEREFWERHGLDMAIAYQIVDGPDPQHELDHGYGFHEWRPNGPGPWKDPIVRAWFVPRVVAPEPPKPSPESLAFDVVIDQHQGRLHITGTLHVVVEAAETPDPPVDPPVTPTPTLKDANLWVKDAATKQGIAGAAVTIDGDTRTTSGAGHTNFALSGPATAHIEAPGYEPKDEDVWPDETQGWADGKHPLLLTRRAAVTPGALPDRVSRLGRMTMWLLRAVRDQWPELPVNLNYLLDELAPDFLQAFFNVGPGGADGDDGFWRLAGFQPLAEGQRRAQDTLQTAIDLCRGRGWKLYLMVHGCRGDQYTREQLGTINSWAAEVINRNVDAIEAVEAINEHSRNRWDDETAIWVCQDLNVKIDPRVPLSVTSADLGDDALRAFDIFPASGSTFASVHVLRDRAHDWSRPAWFSTHVKIGLPFRNTEPPGVGASAGGDTDDVKLLVGDYRQTGESGWHSYTSFDDHGVHGGHVDDRWTNHHPVLLRDLHPQMTSILNALRLVRAGGWHPWEIPRGAPEYDWSAAQWHAYLLEALRQVNAKPVVNTEDLEKTDPLMRRKGAEWQRTSPESGWPNGRPRGRLYLPVRPGGEPWSRYVDVVGIGEDLGVPWRWTNENL